MGTHHDRTIEILRRAMPELRERFGVVSVRLFGSIARREAGPGSDVDILVEFAGPVTLFVLADLRQFLMEALGRPVDVGTEGSLRPRIREAVVVDRPVPTLVPRPGRRRQVPQCRRGPTPDFGRGSCRGGVGGGALASAEGGWLKRLVSPRTCVPRKPR